jgi:hypothetical protein
MDEDWTQYKPPDPTRIDTGYTPAVEYWAKALERSPDQIREAVRKVGPLLDDVKGELGMGGVG